MLNPAQPFFYQYRQTIQMTMSDIFVISGSLKKHTLYIIQGCSLKKIKGSPVLLICETIGAQHVICMKNTKLF